MTTHMRKYRILVTEKSAIRQMDENLKDELKKEGFSVEKEDLYKGIYQKYLIKKKQAFVLMLTYEAVGEMEIGILVLTTGSMEKNGVILVNAVKRCVHKEKRKTSIVKTVNRTNKKVIKKAK